MIETDLFKTVPLDRMDNLRYRRSLLKWARTNKKRQSHLMNGCRRDILFWFSVFAWCYEPRLDSDGVIAGSLPFIPWPHQVPCVLEIAKNFGKRDIGVEKSRGEGMSWLSLMIILHQWIFAPMGTYGIVSRTLAMADTPDDQGSLMWKIDWELTKLPKWMLPTFDRKVTSHSLVNLDTGSAIIAYAASEDVGRGARFTVFFFDEVASWRPPMASKGADEAAMRATQNTTDCRLFVSTPQGPDGAYARMMLEDSNIAKIILDWKDNPTRNDSMFKIEKGQPVACDETSTLSAKFMKEWVDSRRKLEERGYQVSDPNKFWSPWYVTECLRPGATPKLIAQELDRDYGGSISRYFPPLLIDRLIREGCRKELFQGELIFDSDDQLPVFVATPDGRLKIWCKVNQTTSKPPIGRYIVGVDVAAGVGGELSSNSVLSVLNASTGVKVAEFASPVTLPHDLADYSIALCNLFKDHGDHPAFLIWEDGGPGQQFTARIRETTFRNIYFRSQDLDRVSHRSTRKMGWSTNRKSKRQLLGQYLAALSEGLFENPSSAAMGECKQYVIGDDGTTIYHISSKDAEDPSGANESHGDRVIADALCNWVRHQWKLDRLKSKSVNVTEAYVTGAVDDQIHVDLTSALYRRQKYLKSEKRRTFWTDRGKGVNL